ncbi:MAG: hypothetical protein WCL51_15805 [Bacteroidota bacterium]
MNRFNSIIKSKIKNINYNFELIKPIKIIVFLSIYLFISFNYSSYGQKACPTNLDNLTIKEIEKNIDKWEGKIVAFDAIVSEIQVGHVEKPFYKVTVGDEFLWIAAPGESKYIKIGRLHRILGVISKVHDDKINQKYNTKKFFILSIGFFDMETKQGSFFPDAKKQYDEWIKGKMPDSEDE